MSPKTLRSLWEVFLLITPMAALPVTSVKVVRSVWELMMLQLKSSLK